MRTLRSSLASLAVLGAMTAAAIAPSGAATTTLTVTMSAQNSSGETGTATLTEVANGVQVVLTIKGAPSTAQPAHIHEGTCAKLNPAPAYPLTNVTGGTSTTIVKGVTIDDLLAKSYAINVHKSASDLGTYVSCGDITGTPAKS